MLVMRLDWVTASVRPQRSDQCSVGRLRAACGHHLGPSHENLWLISAQKVFRPYLPRSDLLELLARVQTAAGGGGRVLHHAGNGGPSL